MAPNSLPYLIHRDKRAVLVPNMGEDLSLAIPSARPFEMRGKQLWAMPYNTWEAQVLRTKGFMVPSPIGSYYNWPRDRTQLPEPFWNQIETAAFFTLHHRCFCLNEIGTGKTMSALWAADWLMRERMVRKALIIAPLSTLTPVWSDGVFFNMPHRKTAVLHGSAERRRKLLTGNGYDFYVVNHDGVDIISEVKYRKKRAGQDAKTGETIYQEIIDDVMLLRPDIDLVIIDEIGVYRNAKTTRWNVLSHALRPEMWVWGMTGTPIPNMPADAYAEIKLVLPHRVPRYYTDFKHMTMQQLSVHTWIPKQEATRVVFNAMQPAIRFERDQCFDLPPATYSTREVPLTADQKKHYKALSQQLYTEIGEGKVNAVNEAVKAGKLIQCVTGVVYDNEGVPREVDCTPRIEVTKEIIDQCEHKVIIFVPNRAPLEMLARELGKDYTVAVVHGGISKGKRDTIFSEFQRLDDPRILIADAGCMSHGLTLTKASTIIWFGPEVSNDTYEQANGRITRPSQKNNQHIIHLASTPVERRYYQRLVERGRTQGLLLEMVRKGEVL